MEVTIKLANNNGVLTQSPTVVPTLQASTLSDLSKYANISVVVEYANAAYTIETMIRL